LDRINWDPASSDTLATSFVFTEGMTNPYGANVDAYFNYTGYDEKGVIHFAKDNGGNIDGEAIMTNICLAN
jgi:hypothetical protein